MTYENILWDVAGRDGDADVQPAQVLNAMNAADVRGAGRRSSRGSSATAGSAPWCSPGAGEKAFIAGADIAAMAAMGPVEARHFAETAARDPRAARAAAESPPSRR